MRVVSCYSPVNVVDHLRDAQPSAALLGEQNESAWHSIQLAKEIRAYNRVLPIVLLAWNSSEELAIAALRASVSDYLSPPITEERVAQSLSNLICDSPADRAERSTPAGDEESLSSSIIGSSAQIRRVRAQILRLAPTKSTVLIMGETGTGKELVAEALHRNSKRSRGRLMSINCAALPDELLESELFGHERGAYTSAHARYEGKLKLAEGGTVFF